MTEEKEPKSKEQGLDFVPAKYKVTLLSRRTIPIHRVIGEPENQIVITYVAAGMAPATVFIMEDEYTLELEKKLIRLAVEERLKEQAESYEV